MIVRKTLSRRAVSTLRPTGKCLKSAAATPEKKQPVGWTTEEWDLEKAVVGNYYTPAQVVEKLSNHIIGQGDAKRAVAISLRNRWRRTMIADKELRDDIHPKNILMIGPTGVGKTEISRRMAKLTEAPFIKVEATKFTEVGFKGRDVDSIVDDLYIASMRKAVELTKKRNAPRAKEAAIELILQKLIPDTPDEKEKYRKLFDDGDLNDKEIEFTVTVDEPGGQQVRLDTDEDKAQQGVQGVLFFDHKKDEKRTRKLKKKVSEAFPLITANELEKLMDQKQVQRDAVHLAENHGVVFIDEIDKVVTPSHNKKADASAEGVQQDLLPLIEGSVVTIKDGTPIKTDNILFICSGAFHLASPSEMIAELQGRLPVRVELKALTEDDFYRILTEPTYNILQQNIELLKTEGVTLEFTECAKREIAKLTKLINGEMQNIGARRLITVVEKILEDISFNAEDYVGKTATIDAKMCQEKVADLRKDAKDPTKCFL
eukprot:TRINITY_DN2646_c3_g2_i2.p1 TRINITY_DN2646_c3_g2~~TRINITY_DN2646_c3_g2_i2.p1  ORF type:complete len:487 (+),score=99.40 TRINITY_DN2646_c3_g2_i2:86-1546(+)